MSVSGVSQWVMRQMTQTLSSFSSWHIGVAATIALIGIPILMRKMGNHPKPYLFQTWVVDGKEVQFYLKSKNAFYVEVIQQSDRKHLFTTEDFLLTQMDPKLDPIAKGCILKSSLVFLGWIGSHGLSACMSSSSPIHSWKFEDQTMCLFSRSEGLLWKCTQGGRVYWAKDVSDKKGQERLTEIMQQTKPVQWDFAQNYPIFKQYEITHTFPLPEDAALSLVHRDPAEEPMWQLMNSRLQKTSWMPLDPDLLKYYSAEDRIARIQRQQIACIANNEVSLVQHSGLLSRFNSNAFFDAHRWAITLLDVGICSKDYSTWGGHAAIVVEGIEDNLPFAEYIDLRPKGHGKAAVSLKELSLNETVTYRTILRSPVCVEKDKVQSMLRSIRDERKWDIPFDKRGIHAFKRWRSHNCISWARSKLSIADIHMRTSIFSWIADIPKRYYS